MRRAGISLTARAKPANWPLLIAAEQKSNPRLVDPKGDFPGLSGMLRDVYGQSPPPHITRLPERT
jgi:hypothetical protein